MEALPYTESRPLPPYRALLVVDAKDFTRNPSVLHADIAEEIPALLERAFRRVGLGEVWEHGRHLGYTGDGMALGFDPAHLPRLIHPFLRGLQDVLADRNARIGRYEAVIRLRVSLHVGPVSERAEGRPGDGDGAPRNDVHRLLDSKPVKFVLAAASEHVTQVAAILSDRVYTDAVLGGYTGRHPDHFHRVDATVPGKDFAEPAWLHVPELPPSLMSAEATGEDVRPPTTSRPPGDGPPSGGSAPSGGVRVRDNSGQVAGVVHGGMSMNRPSETPR